MKNCTPCSIDPTQGEIWSMGNTSSQRSNAQSKLLGSNIHMLSRTSSCAVTLHVIMYIGQASSFEGFNLLGSIDSNLGFASSGTYPKAHPYILYNSFPPGYLQYKPVSVSAHTHTHLCLCLVLSLSLSLSLCPCLSLCLVLEQYVYNLLVPLSCLGAHFSLCFVCVCVCKYLPVFGTAWHRCACTHVWYIYLCLSLSLALSHSLSLL